MTAHLIGRTQATTLEEKVQQALTRIEGTYGIAVLHVGFPDQIVVARNGSPVVLSVGEHKMFVASDLTALVRHTRQVVTLDHGEIATLTAGDFRTYTAAGDRASPEPTTIEWEAGAADPCPWAATTSSCTRRSSSSRTQWTGCCAGGSTTGSPPCASAG